MASVICSYKSEYLAVPVLTEEKGLATYITVLYQYSLVFSQPLLGYGTASRISTADAALSVLHSTYEGSED